MSAELMHIADFPTYDEYKDSGVGWIAYIPSKWDLQKLKNLFYEKKHTQNMSLNSGSISFGEVIQKDDDKILESTKKSYQEVLEGEFLINPLNLNYDLISLRIALSDINVVVSAGYIVIKHKVDLDLRYFKYLLHRYDVAYMKLLGSGVRQTINFNHIANSLLPFPIKKEQTLIAQFLDQKTALIDQAIAIKEQQIKLLNERKQIIIQQAVTQGLNPNTPMKDSGVEWIGQIPEHWEVLALKYLTELIQTGPFGTELHASDYAENKTPLINPKHIQSGKIEFESNCTVDDETVLRLSKYQLQKKDLVFARRGELGRCAVINNREHGWVCGTGSMMVRLKQRITPNFLYFIFAQDGAKASLSLNSVGSTMDNLNTTILGNFLIAFPPIKEQKDIVSWILKKHQEIDNSKLIKAQQTQALKEYKTTLINSAVTGKIKITEAMLTSTTEVIHAE